MSINLENNMTKVVSLSGAQGGGKSTLLTELHDRGWVVDDFKVSRAVQEKLGWSTIDNVLSSWDTMIQFQEQVLDEKFNRDLSLRELGSSSVILTERSFVDVAAYTTYWVWELHSAKKVDFSEAAKWLGDYVTRCSAAQLRCYDAVLILPWMPHIAWENDPNRASKESARSIGDSIFDLANGKRFQMVQKFVITEKNTEDRATEVENFLRTL